MRVGNEDRTAKGCRYAVGVILYQYAYDFGALDVVARARPLGSHAKATLRSIRRRS